MRLCSSRGQRGDEGLVWQEDAQRSTGHELDEEDEQGHLRDIYMYG
jgi:hypothetical protein